MLKKSLNRHADTAIAEGESEAESPNEQVERANDNDVR
jgi:hypothetical protein